MKQLIRNIANNKITKRDVINTVKENDVNILEIKKMKRSGNRSIIISLYNDFIPLFGSDYDNADNAGNLIMLIMNNQILQICLI